MDAVKYFKIKSKMTNGCHWENCGKCTLSNENNGMDKDCNDLEMLYPEKAIEIVEKWELEHRISYADDFISKFPNSNITKDMLYDRCREVYYGGHCNFHESGSFTCQDCWDKSIEDK